MKEVKLRMKENKNRAAKKLGISKKQINHLIIKYKESGKSAFVHDNRGHIPTKALDKTLSEDIITLYKNKYYNFNFNHEVNPRFIEFNNLILAPFKIISFSLEIFN